MAVAHPTAGSFGVYAELYLQSLGRIHGALHLLGGAVHRHRRRSHAIAIYCQWWFPNTPQVAVDARILGRAALRQRAQRGQLRQLRILVRDDQGGRHRAVHRVRRWLCSAGSSPRPAIGFSQLHRVRRLSSQPAGTGVWMAMVFVIFSYIGTEVVAVTAGEAEGSRDRRAARHANHGRPPDSVLPGRHLVLIASCPGTRSSRARMSPRARSSSVSA